MYFEIETPKYGLTMRPPIAQAMLRGRRIDNRDWTIFKQIQGYRGPILLSQTMCNEDHLATAQETWRQWFDEGRVAEPWPVIEKEARELAGKVFGVAMLHAALNPLEAHGLPGHRAGQVALVLGDVFRVKPVSCGGGVGFWHTYRCSSGHLSAGTWQPGKRWTCEPCQKRTNKELGTLQIIAEPRELKAQIGVIRQYGLKTILGDEKTNGRES